MAKPASPAKRTRRVTPATARAAGRSLADFGRLSQAEKRLLEGYRLGNVAVIADDLPEEATVANQVRAAFVRFLALGGDEETPVHERGLQLLGAWLTGVLDLQSAKVEHRIGLWNCRIERIDARQSSLRLLNLTGCHLAGGLMGDGLRCDGGLFLCDGFHSTGEVRLLAAMIGGNLECDGGRFENPGANALSCDRAAISGTIRLGTGFHATGEVRLEGATIGGDLDCSGGRFENAGDCAISGSRTTVSGSVQLRHGFSAVGAVRLVGAVIGGGLDCTHGRFEGDGRYTLLCDTAQVSGACMFRSLNWAGGIISLASMRVGILCDEMASWKHASAQLVLDGFTYGSIVGPTAATTRIAWLDLQRHEHLGATFKPQPWDQLIAVLRAMGHSDEARAVAIAKEDRLRRAGRVARGGRTFHWLYGLLLGYGYRPLLMLRAFLAVWFLCALVYWAAANPAWFGATTPLIVPAKGEPNAVCLARAAGRTDEHCPPLNSDYRTFVPLVYSADVLLPILSLGYKEAWQPVVSDRDGKPLFWGQLLRYLYWFEIAFGWLVGLQLAGMLGNLIKKD